MPDAQVIDLYHLDAEPDFHALKAQGVVGVILKATQGVTGVDPKFEGWYERALSVFGAGLVHSYHMLDGYDGEDEAKHYLSVTDGKPGRWLDYELAQTSLNNALTACHHVANEQGSFPGMYGSNQGQLGLALFQGHFTVCPLWIARYGPKPPLHKCDLWQFAEGNTPGHTYDSSVYLGRSAASLTKWMGGMCIPT